MKDHVLYIDTDSLFLGMEDFFLDYGIGKEKWLVFPEERKIDMILNVSKILEEHVNDLCYTDLQDNFYNSGVSRDVFSIVFKQEILCKTALFCNKKKYGYHLVNEEGTPKDKIAVTGLEIIRSETPKAFKIILEDVLDMILKNTPDSTLLSFIEKSKKELKSANYVDLSSNIGVNKMSKYINDDLSCKKGTPYHVRGAANYHKLLKTFNISHKYPHIMESSKASVIYVQKNSYNVEVLSYIEWPAEFKEHHIIPDFNKQIDKFFINKVKGLLEPIGKENILNQNKNFGKFFN